MIALAALCAFSALRLVEQPLPGIEVGSRSFPAGLAATNTTPLDFNADGLTDLLLPSGIWIQRAGEFPRASMVPLPAGSRPETSHAADGHLFVYTENHLVCYSLLARRWQSDWEASLDLDPTARAAETPLFQDLDGDGRAELIVPLAQGFRIFYLTPGAPPAGTLSIYPPIRPRLDPVFNLWASDTRPAASATASRDFTISFAEASVSVREARRVSDIRTEHYTVVYPIERQQSGLLAVGKPHESVTSPLPDGMVPCRLRKNGPLAYAGSRSPTSNRFELGRTVTEVLIAPEQGAPLQSVRTKSSPVYLALADFDGDGDDDLLTQSNSVDSGPPREIIMALASARRIRNEFFVHVQEADGHFAAEPRHAFAVDLELGGPAMKGGPRWEAYRRGELTCASADFDGDGRADIAAWSAPSRLFVWLNHEGVFNTRPDEIIQPGVGRGFVPADVDADGRADIVILPPMNIDARPRVFFSR